MLQLDADALRPILPTVLDSLTDAIVVVDRERRVIAANRRYLELNRAVRDTASLLRHQMLKQGAGADPV